MNVQGALRLKQKCFYVRFLTLFYVLGANDEENDDHDDNNGTAGSSTGNLRRLVRLAARIYVLVRRRAICVRRRADDSAGRVHIVALRVEFDRVRKGSESGSSTRSDLKWQSVKTGP